MLPSSWWAPRATRPPILGRMRVVPKIGGPGAALITCMARHCHARLASRWQSQPTRPTAAHTTFVACGRRLRRGRPGAAHLRRLAVGALAQHCRHPGACCSQWNMQVALCALVFGARAPTAAPIAPATCLSSVLRPAVSHRAAAPALSKLRAMGAATLQSWTSDRQWRCAPRCLRRAAPPPRNCAFQGTMSRTTAEQIIWTDRDCAPDRIPTQCKQTATDKLQVRPEPTRPRQLTRTLSKMEPLCAEYN